MTEFNIDKAEWQKDSGGAWLRLRVTDPRTATEVCRKMKDGKTYSVRIKQYNPKRSLDANALYWSLLGKLAAVLNTSTSELHNIMLRRYGQLERFGGKLVYVVIPETEDAQKKTDAAESYHLKPTSQVKQGSDGKMYRTYLMLRGSSTYDTKEMSSLIDGLISECNEAGIDTTSYKDRGLLE